MGGAMSADSVDAGTPGATSGGDTSTLLAQDRTDLAVARNVLASERTLMGWIRTTISMISFGFTIGKLGQTFREVEVGGVLLRSRTLSVETIAYYLVVIGTLALVAAIAQHILRVRTYRAMGYRGRFSLAVWVAVLLVGLGGLALTALVANL